MLGCDLDFYFHWKHRVTVYLGQIVYEFVVHTNGLNAKKLIEWLILRFCSMIFDILMHYLFMRLSVQGSKIFVLIKMQKEIGFVVFQ